MAHEMASTQVESNQGEKLVVLCNIDSLILEHIGKSHNRQSCQGNRAQPTEGMLEVPLEVLREADQEVLDNIGMSLLVHRSNDHNPRSSMGRKGLLMARKCSPILGSWNFQRWW